MFSCHGITYNKQQLHNFITHQWRASFCWSRVTNSKILAPMARGITRKYFWLRRTSIKRASGPEACSPGKVSFLRFRNTIFHSFKKSCFYRVINDIIVSCEFFCQIKYRKPFNSNRFFALLQTEKYYLVNFGFKYHYKHI